MAATVDASGVVNAFNRLPQYLKQDTTVAVKEWLTEVQRYARQNHRYQQRTSPGLTGSIQVDIAPNIENSKVYLETGIAHYGPYIHEGFKSWKADQFLYEAAEVKRKDLVPMISKAIARSIKRAGL